MLLIKYYIATKSFWKSNFFGEKSVYTHREHDIHVC